MLLMNKTFSLICMLPFSCCCGKKCIEKYEKKIDVKVALSKLKKHTGAHTLLLEGGSIINGAFQRADVIDEISLVTAPVVAEKGDKPLFLDGATSLLDLINSETVNGVIVSKYKRKA